MDSLFCTYKNNQEIISEPKKSDHSSQYLLSTCHHHSLTTVRLTCEGNLDEPNFSQKLKKIISKLKILVSNDKKPIKVTKVEPWNSVRVTINLSNDAAQRLRQLAAEHGGENLRELGIYAIQIEGQQVISLRLSNQNSANNTSNLTCNIDQVNSLSNVNNNSISLINQNKEIPSLKDSCSNDKYPFGQVNGAIGDESSNSSSSCHEQSQISSESRSSLAKINSFLLESKNDTVDSGAQSSSASTSTPPPSSFATSQQQKVYLSQPTSRASNSLLLPNTRPSPEPSLVKASFQSPSTNTSNFDEVSANESSVVIPKVESISAGVASNSGNISPVVLQAAPRFQTAPLSTSDSNVMTTAISNNQLLNSQLTSGFGSNIRNGNSNHFNGPRPLLISSTSQTFVSSHKSVPPTSTMQSVTQSVKPADSVVLHSSKSLVEPNIKLQQPFDHNANYVNSNSTTAPAVLPIYQPLSTNASMHVNTTTDTEVKLQPNLCNQTDSPAIPGQTNSSSDILGSSADAVDDDLLASVAATGANSIDFNNLTDLNDLNLLSMLEEMESANQPSAASSDIVNSNTNSSNESSQPAECTASPTTVTVTSSVAPVSATIDEFRSPNVIAPQSSQAMPFFLAQQQQQVSTKIGTPVIAGGQPIIINSSTGAVLSQSQAQHLSQQIIASTTTATSLPQSTLYPFTSMQHASLFTNKQQVSPQQPSSPRHVIVPVRQIPAVRAATSQQVQASSQQPQTVPMVRALPPTINSPAGDLIVPNSGPQQSLYRPVNNQQLVRQQLPTTSNASMTFASKPQQQQIVIRQSYSASQQVTNASNASQQNAVALSSPLLVNLLQSDVQPSSTHPQQHQQFVTQTGAPQIKLIAPSGTHTDGTQLMMMVRVSSAPQGGTTTQLINPATGSIVATMPTSQVVTSIASPVVDQQVNISQANDTSIASTTPKPKKPRKSRSKKNQAENGKNESSVQTSMPMTPVQQVTSSISSGAITSIPLSLATSNSSRLQSSPVSTILTFPTSSIAQTLKLQTSTTNPQQTLLSSQAGPHLFNPKRVQPVVMIAATNPNLLSQSAETNVSVANSIVSSTGAFILTNVAANCFSGNTGSTSTTTTSGVHLSGQGQRKQIFLATKSNSFPVSSALSAGAIMARLANNPTSSSSSQSLISSPVKFVSQAASSPVPICVAVSSNSCSPQAVDCSLPNLANKSSLGSVVTSTIPLAAPVISSNVASTINAAVTTASITLSSLNSSVSPIVTSMIQSSPVVSTPTKSFVPSTSKAPSASILPSDAVPSSAAPVLVTATKSVSPAVSISSENIVSKNIVPINVSTNVTPTSMLLNQLTPSNASILAVSPKILTTAFSQFSNNSTPKPLAFPVTQPCGKQVFPVKLEADLKEVPSLSGNSGDSPFVVKNEECITNVFPAENKISKPETIETFFTSSNINDSKKPDIPKHVPKSSFKFEMDDSPKLESDYIDETDRLNSAPVSPSYFLAPLSAFENKSTESKEYLSSNSFELNNSSSGPTTSTSNVDLTNTSSINALPTEIHNEKSSVSFEVSSSAAITKSIVEPVASVTPLSILSTAKTTTTATNVTSTEANKATCATATLTKPTETTPSKSNSFSYFLSKHSYSQDLPDHILDDEDDDDDADDYGLGLGIFPTASRLLSGRIGTVGGNANLGISSSQEGTSLSTTITTPKLSDPFNSLSSSNTENSIFEIKKQETKSNESHKSTTSSEVKHSSFQTETNSDISNVESNTKIEIESNNDPSSITMPINESNASDNITISSLSPTNALFHRIMNGDISSHSSTNKLGTGESISNTSQMTTGIKSTTLQRNDKKNVSSIGPLRQYQVASKSYPEVSNVSNVNASNINVLGSNAPEPFKATITTESPDLINNSVISDNKVPTAKETTLKSTSKSTKTRKPSSMTNKTNTPSANKSRRKPATSTTTTVLPPTLIVSDSLFPATSALKTKSELHSLLASPTVTGSKSNISVMTNISTVEPMSSSTESSSISNSSTESSTSRPLFITFKQPTQQSVANSIQIPNQQQVNQEISSTPTSSTAQMMKVLVPGVSLQGAAGNKVLTLAPSGSSTISSSVNSVSQVMSNAIASKNSSDNSQNKSQAMAPVLGRYILATKPGQPYGQFVVVKSNFSSTSVSGANPAPPFKFITASPSANLSTVSGASTSQPLFMVANAGPTLLSVKPNTQTIASADLSLSSNNVINEKPTNESDNESKKIRKISTNMITSPFIATTNECTNVLTPFQSGQQISQVDSSGNTNTASSSMATIESTSATFADKVAITKEDKVAVSTNIDISKTEDHTLSKEMAFFASSESSVKPFPSVSLVGNPSETIKQQNDLSLSDAVVSLQDPNDVKIASDQTTLVNISKSILKNDIIDSSMNKLAIDKNNHSTPMMNILTNSLVLPKEKNELMSMPSSMPLTVQLVLPASSAESLVSVNSTSATSNVAKLRVDPPKAKEIGKDLFGIKSNVTSSTANKRPTLIAKPLVTVHQQHMNPQTINTSHELAQSTVFATKTSGTSFPSSKTIPTILRQSKRKADSLYQITNSNSDSMHATKFVQQLDQSNSEYSELSEVDTSGVSLISSMKTNKANFRPVPTNEPNSMLPIIEYVDDNNTEITEIGQVGPKPRKRARKSKVTTIQQPTSSNELGTSLLYNVMPIEVETEMNENDARKSASSPRVLRNTGTPTAYKSTTVGNANKRVQRNRNTLIQSIPIQIVSVAATQSTSTFTSTESIILTNSTPKCDKSRKLREATSNSNLARQTRSNRNRNKSEQSLTTMNSTNEILITDNAVDESPHLVSMPDLEMISLPMENHHLSVLNSDVLLGQQSSSHVNNFSSTPSPCSVDQRTHLIVESGNSNSSTASSSSSNSLLQRTQRPRKPLPSPTATSNPTNTKPSLRSNSASDSLTSPMTPNKRRRVANK